MYPEKLDGRPDVPSPFLAEGGIEVVTAQLKNDRFALIEVTVENGAPLKYSTRIDDLFGKDQQLHVDSGDFPTLARTGLHSEPELDGKTMVTGFPVSLITYIGRPGRFSTAGFMAEDEDIITVLKNDNRLVQELGLTHPQTARPLFHVWNIILKEIELGNWARFWDNISSFFYNGRQVRMTAESGKGWQVSIFQDEVQGRFNINVQCDLSEDEINFLRDNYPHLTEIQMKELADKLTHVHFSEMAPYYIMYYGFYEGHTEWRADPVSIAFVFGLKSLEKIEKAFHGDLYNVLMNPFTKESFSRSNQSPKTGLRAPTSVRMGITPSSPGFFDGEWQNVNVIPKWLFHL